MKREPITSLATRIYDDCDHDEEAAIAKLVEQASKVDSYRKELIYLGAKSLISAIFRSDRNAILVRESKPFVPTRHAETAAVDAMERAKNMSNYVRHTFMGMRFSYKGRRMRLADMTKPALGVVAEDYTRKGATMMKRGRWLFNLSEQMSDDSVVSQVFSEDEVKEMYHAA